MSAVPLTIMIVCQGSILASVILTMSKLLQDRK